MFVVYLSCNHVLITTHQPLHFANFRLLFYGILRQCTTLSHPKRLEKLCHLVAQLHLFLQHVGLTKQKIQRLKVVVCCNHSVSMPDAF